MRTGKFSADDMTILVRIWAYHYFGGIDQIPTINDYAEVTGLKPHVYKRLRAELRKVGVFSWDKHARQWLIRRPDMWLAEHVAAEQKTRHCRPVRKAIKASDAVQLELV